LLLFSKRSLPFSLPPPRIIVAKLVGETEVAEMREGRVSANGVDFAYLSQGEGELALCLHGFPDWPGIYGTLMPALAQAGYRAVAPYMRGYAPTAIPADGRYQTAALAQDAVALIGALGAESAVLIGHDWGAAAAYGAAILAPQRVRRLVAAAVPFGPSLPMSLIANPAQQKRSWYMYLLISPLGEVALSYGDFGLIDRLWADWSPGFEPDAAYRAALKNIFRQPGVAAAAASYYKHTFLAELQDPALAELQQAIGGGTIAVPTLYLHGADDGCVGADITPDAERFSAGLETVCVPGAGHFLLLERPEITNPRILEFLRT
jgi:pimeloyl-ACP methyl ester carboxylesterase